MNMQTICKLIGCAGVLVSAVLWGIYKIRTERRKTDELAAFCDLVGYIGENIAHFSKPLPEIYAAYSDKTLSDGGFLAILRKSGMKTATESLAVFHEREVGGEMLTFASRIGDGYREEQTALCEYTKSRLGGMLEKRKTASRDREKLYRTVPLLVALSVLLMFI